MILDTSAILAITFDEPVAPALLDALDQAGRIACGTPTLAEAGIVLGHRRGFDFPYLPGFLQEFGVNQIPFGPEHWAEAMAAYERFGKGRHPAGLNFGDCLRYATAKLAQRPLVCVGEDFSATGMMPPWPTRAGRSGAAAPRRTPATVSSGSPSNQTPAS